MGIRFIGWPGKELSFLGSIIGSVGFLGCLEGFWYEFWSCRSGVFSSCLGLCV